jgi:type IV pilus assembly protein PilC
VNLLVGEGGLPAYVRATGTVLGIFYGLVLLGAIIVPLVSRAGANDASLDASLRSIPLIGKARRALAVSRFCGTFDLQLDAGVNVIESLTTAARASRSGLLNTLARRAVKRLREGQSLSEVLGCVRGALPGPALDAVVIAEESGELHRVLPELRAEYEEEGLRRLRTAAVWIPKMLYLSVVVYLGYRIISFYMNYFKQVNSIIDGIGN